ncbi:MAG: acyl-CoA dehydrogenase [Calditrichaeota bacterium]|nr:MAG: acyl-CoA dehydrogenase [Calditrichota bacterium]
MKTGGSFLVKPICQEEIFTPEKFSPEQQEIARTVKEFAEQRVRPNKQEIEKYNKELSLQLLRECGELGLLSIDIPEKYGGLGLDKVTSAIVAENIAYGMCASFSTTFGAHTGIGTLPLVFFGNEEQKQKYLPKLASAEWVAAYALTEPESGSDALAAKTTATLSKDGKFYILNGSKQFITNAAWANLFTTFAQVDGKKFTGFLVERNTPGLSIGPEEHKLGVKGSSTCSVYFENTKIPVQNVLGEIGRGAEIAFNSLNIGRFKLGAATLGGCKVSINEALQYASQRRQFGQLIREFDVIKSYFAEMVVRTYALDSIVYRTIGLIDEAIAQIPDSAQNYQQNVAEAIERFAIEASMCKVVGSETLWFVADTGLQIHGGYGFIEEYPMASILRDNRIDRIWEGTNEINRQIITGYFLKKSLMEELPVRESVKKIKPDGTSEMARSLQSEDPLYEEKLALEAAKELVLFVFNEAICEFGQDLRNEQQVAILLSDMFTDIYLMDSVLSRITQHFKSNGLDSIKLAVARTLCAERLPGLINSSRKILSAFYKDKYLQKALKQISSFEERLLLKTNVIELKRVIAEDLYETGGYHY